MATIQPDTPIIGDLSPAQVADLIDQAATLIETDGLEVGDYWTKALFQPYEPGMPCCTVGALAAVSGYRDGIDAEKAFVGVGDYDPATGVTEPDSPHLVMVAAMKALGFREAEDLYDWSDNAGDREVVAELRNAAAQIRAQAGGAA
ncbi:DUF6197 family protein [Pseudonocardia sp. CA-142604]|uniref:DUF6197 family protein n=1 Tax=Pseudonocardia sp. CA-142604 TaxID=3240024 RepID=UPI003D8F43C3